MSNTTLSTFKNSLQQTMVAENFIWDDLSQYFRLKIISSSKPHTNQTVRKLCDYPGLLSFISSNNLFCEKSVAEFFEFERMTEPSPPLYLSETAHPIEWMQYYKSAIAFHGRRCVVLKAFVNTVYTELKRRQKYSSQAILA